MDFDEFHKQLANAPISFRDKLRYYLMQPTERSACYIAGYVAALEDARLFKSDAASYWLALIHRTEGNGALGCDLITEMDNHPSDCDPETFAVLLYGRTERELRKAICEWLGLKRLPRGTAVWKD